MNRLAKPKMGPLVRTHVWLNEEDRPPAWSGISNGTKFDKSIVSSLAIYGLIQCARACHTT